MLAAIRQWVIKTMMKGNTGVVQTMPKQQIIEMNVQITAERIMRNGINPEDLKSVGQVENVVNQIEQPKVNVNPGMTSVKKADVLDMEGNKIPEGSGIMAGKEINQKNLNEELMKTDNPYSELVNTPRPRTLAEREADVLAGMEKNNKEMVQRIRDRKNKPLDPNDVLPDYNETPGAFTRRNTPGSKENLLQELKIAYEKDFNKLRGDETVEELQSILKDLDKNGEPFADGGRIGLLAGSVPKISAVISRLLKNKKKVDQAVNDIFPTGDYKYDAQMAADAIVENNPKTFKGMLYEDLDMDTQMEVYGAALSGVNKQNALMLQMKKATRPEKTLASMKEGKGINMSDPDIADEFARFMKETDPKGTKELEQKLQLENFKTKDRSENADGGRIGLKGGLSKAFIEFLKKTGKTMNDKNPIDLGKDYLKYVKDESIKGNSKKIAPGVLTIGGGGILANRYVGRRLEEMNKKQKMEMYEDTKKEFIEEYKNDPQLLEIVLKNLDDKTFGKVEEKANGGRIGLKDGTFEDYMRERERLEKERGLEQLFKEYKEDLRRQEVGEQKQMAADGGRIGLKAGMTKRAFLKLMGAGVAGVGAVKSGLFSIGKGATKQVAKEVAQQTTSGMPPPYFFKLAEKIKKMGDDVTAKSATKDREVVTKFKEYEMTEDISTGEITIQRMKIDDDLKYDASEYYGRPVGEDVYMSYKPGKGQVDETMKGKTPPDEYTEDTSLIRSDRPAEGEIMETFDGVPDDILEEVGEAKSIKRASGGLAYMLGE